MTHFLAHFPTPETLLDIKARMRDIIAKEAAAVSAINVTDEFEQAAHIIMIFYLRFSFPFFRRTDHENCCL